MIDQELIDIYEETSFGTIENNKIYNHQGEYICPLSEEYILTYLKDKDMFNCSNITMDEIDHSEEMMRTRVKPKKTKY